MDIEQALSIVLELAEENVLSEVEAQRNGLESERAQGLAAVAEVQRLLERGSLGGYVL